jgi:hypothetical protein
MKTLATIGMQLSKLQAKRAPRTERGKRDEFIDLIRRQGKLLALDQ